MAIYIGSDHGGYELKKIVKEHLLSLGHEVLDFGVFDVSVSVDYPDVAREVSEKVLENENSFGVLICGTGMGMAIAANKLKGIRAVTVHDVTTARLARAHNDANILTFGQRIIGSELAKDILDAYLSTEFEAGRHAARLSKISRLENMNEPLKP